MLRTLRLRLGRALLATSLAAPVLAQAAPVHHKIRLELDPQAHSLVAMDEISGWPQSGNEVRFRLNAALTPLLAAEDLLLKEAPAGQIPAAGSGEMGSALPLRNWVIARRDGQALQRERSLLIKFEGKIHNEVEGEGREYARSFGTSAGIISEEGAVLSGSSWWLPSFDSTLVTFDLEVNLPTDWDVVSQGKRSLHEIAGPEGEQRRRVRWECEHPMEEVYLIAARFHEYSSASGAVTAYAFLREEDPGLAGKYLEVTAQYIDMYRQLIGPYPFAKFALVENFWETGYGMPSFTLLGPAVIRLPFILHSSYPHEILHNWWGNGVYVDYDSGNWCEGLTAYLADHLIKEGRGLGHEYRRDALNSYRSYVGAERDFPLNEFRSRHSSATQAVGYGKSLMLWHMLRRKLGDDAFRSGLQSFYRQFRFRRASFSDLRDSFAQASDQNLDSFFAQWVDRTGAPNLQMEVEPGVESIHIDLLQDQRDPAYVLDVPLAITREGRDEAEWMHVSMQSSKQSVELSNVPTILRVDVDPEFDLFRRLHRDEIPPTLSAVLGSEAVTIIVPSPTEDSLADGWLELAQGWQADDASISVVQSKDLTQLPRDRDLWILGRNNRWASSMTDALAQRGVQAAAAPDNCFTFVVRHPADPELSIAWVGSDSAQAQPGLGRKLPHYGKYSFLEFTGAEPTIHAKGQWSAASSPMVWTAPTEAASSGDHARAALPERAPLAELAPSFDPEALMDHVRALSSEKMQGRGLGTDGIQLAEAHIAQAFAAAGLEPGGSDGSFIQSWRAAGGPDGEEVRLANVIGILRGRNADMKDQSVVVSAHYDHLGFGWPDARAGMEGQLHPGADDNASGVAVLIEVARNLVQTLEPDRSLVFVAFSGEEWDLKGSREFLRRSEPLPAEQIFAMVNLDSVGRLEGKPITVFGSGSASEWMHIAMGIGFVTGIQSKCIPDDPGGSDQVNFQRAGIPAVQLFSGLHGDYHRPSDTADRVDSGGMIQVATFLKEMLLYLSSRPDPLSSTLGDNANEGEKKAPSAGQRRVSLGTMPDFAFTGPGVRASAITPNSAAEVAGLLAGDIILSMDGVELDSVRTYSDELKAHAPGDVVVLNVKRDDKEVAITVTLRAR